jgi:hypothetical protein
MMLIRLIKPYVSAPISLKTKKDDTVSPRSVLSRTLCLPLETLILDNYIVLLFWEAYIYDCLLKETLNLHRLLAMITHSRLS